MMKRVLMRLGINTINRINNLYNKFGFYNKAMVVSNAISLYFEILKLRKAGKKILLKNSNTGETRELIFLD